MSGRAYDELRKRRTETAQEITGRVWCSHGAHHTAPVGTLHRGKRFVCAGCEKDAAQRRPTPAQRNAHAALTLTALQGKRVNAARGGRAESQPSDYQRPAGSPSWRVTEERRERADDDNYYGV